MLAGALQQMADRVIPEDAYRLSVNCPECGKVRRIRKAENANRPCIECVPRGQVEAVTVTCPYCEQERSIKIQRNEKITNRPYVACANKLRRETLANRVLSAIWDAPCGRQIRSTRDGRCREFMECQNLHPAKYEECMDVAAKHNWPDWRCVDGVLGL